MARVARHYGSFVPGILPSTPSGPAAAPLSASASCLRVKTAALNHSAISPELVVCSKARVARHYGSFVPGILPFTLRGQRLRRCPLRLPASASRLLP
jgi:hypothetical protein